MTSIRGRMKIGITYDLKDDYLAQGFDKEACAEFDSIDTINAIDDFLKTRGHETQRIGNVQALVRALSSGTRWDIVFNIAEGMVGRAREAQIPALLDAYTIPYVFSDPLVLSLTLDKALTKRVVRDMGVRTAQFAEFAVGSSQLAEKMPYPLFVKPNADGTGKGITGTGEMAKVLGVMEIILNEKADKCGYTYENKQQYEDRVEYKLVSDEEAFEAADIALHAWNALGCRDGGRVDVRSDHNGKPHFLEVNPLAGLHPVLGDLVILSRLAGVSYHDLLGRILDSALCDTNRFPSLPKVAYA